MQTSFDTQLTEATVFYHTVKASLSSAADLTRLSASTMISVATLWESFISDLIVAYINRDPSQFAVHLQQALKQDMSDKQKQILNRYAPYRPPTSIDRSTITSLIDNNGNNITFSNAQALKKGAKRWVGTANMAGINALTTQQMAIIDLWIALRNHIAHDSERSKTALQSAVSHGALHGTGLHRAKNAIHTPGVYLKSKHRRPIGNPRIEEILRHMQQIAATM
ncbi:MAG: hypothetical protein KKB02_16435 [Alphaproteobacteria bacterium]|nr:hypothetical protein [Alphaproteobacteria bacterium]